MRTRNPSLIPLFSALLGSALLAPLALAMQAPPDVVVADFDGDNYGDWKTEGTAFGTAPARGTLPGQMPVSGFQGRGLVNSFLNGDGSTGTLTSPPFKIERRYLNFLIGGGKYLGELGVELLLDGKTVRTATGPNDRPGGSEQLAWHTWDVSEFSGKTVTFRIVDARTGGWGHINVDQIVMSERKLQEEPARRELRVESRYLHLPVKNGAPKRRVKITSEGRTVREFEITLADAAPDFWVFTDLEGLKGKTIAVEVDRLPGDSTALAKLVQAAEVPDAANLYAEKHRPQFHFTSRRGWLNDPNGLVYTRGEYHLYYQHNPYGWDWGNMHWGHAVSPDLVHWKEQPIALYPREFGDWAFSGSAVVDAENTSGFRKGDGELLVAAYTSTGRGECIVYSNDGGRTWTEYEGNPVVRHQGRDPRLLWHAPSRRWVMALYDEPNGARDITFYTSPDLKKWEFASRIGGFFECPDLFALPVDGKAGQEKWVVYGADGQYLVGNFDGREFHPDGPKHKVWHGNFYAAQTYSNAPEGRRIQIGWGNGITFPRMPFNQQMTVPVELTLRTTAAGPRLFAEPVRELEKLRKDRHSRKDLVLKTEETPLDRATGDLFELRLDLEPGAAATTGLEIRGMPVLYSAAKGELTCGKVTAPVALDKGRLRLHVLVDRGSVEVFTNDGAVAISAAAIPPDAAEGIKLISRGGAATVRKLEWWELKSAWKQAR